MERLPQLPFRDFCKPYNWGWRRPLHPAERDGASPSLAVRAEGFAPCLLSSVFFLSFSCSELITYSSGYFCYYWAFAARCIFRLDKMVIFVDNRGYERWYVVCTKSKNEERAAGNLAGGKIEVFAPKIKFKRYKEGKFVLLQSRCFPDIFCEVPSHR